MSSSIAEAFREALNKSNTQKTSKYQEEDYWSQVIYFVNNTPDIPKILLTYDYWYQVQCGVPKEIMEKFPNFKCGMVFMAESDFFQLLEEKRKIGIQMELLDLNPVINLPGVKEAKVLMISVNHHGEYSKEDNTTTVN